MTESLNQRNDFQVVFFCRTKNQLNVFATVGVPMGRLDIEKNERAKEKENITRRPSYLFHSH